jgi:sortase A
MIYTYQENASKINQEEKNKMISEACDYNDYILSKTNRYSVTKEEKLWYESLLNVNGSIMATIEIEKIHVNIPIYHGDSEEVLQKRVGHVSASSLPLGQTTSHCVLMGHRGLPSARLFTDLDQMEKGDMFYVHVLDETLAYQVDQILDMVDKNDAEALGEALACVEGEDYVTLFTCTPYGVNSHRLLVRGTRVPYTEELQEQETITAPEAMVKSIQNYYMIYLILGLAITVLVIVIMKFAMNRKNRREKRD